MRRQNFMDAFLATSPQKREDWYQRNLQAFLNAVDCHGETARQHHDQLVNKYIAKPSDAMNETHLDKLTASGPPLPVLLDGLEKLRDRRAAANREDIRTRYSDIATLRSYIGENP
jgi:hypothetical protein